MSRGYAAVTSYAMSESVNLQGLPQCGGQKQGRPKSAREGATVPSPRAQQARDTSFSIVWRKPCGPGQQVGVASVYLARQRVLLVSWSAKTGKVTFQETCLETAKGTQASLKAA